MAQVTEIPAELNAALIAFNNDLVRWLDGGGDDRVREFEPFDAWLEVADLLMVRVVN